MKYPLVILAMGGIGDSIYQRPFIRTEAAAREVFLSTPWPELFEDLPNVRFIRPVGMDLRTQSKNIDRYPDDFWARRPVQAERIRPKYMLHADGVSIIEELSKSFPSSRHRPFVFDLPDFSPPPVRYKRYAVVRPVTLRKEWLAGARNPEPTYVAEAALALKAEGYRVVSVADVDGKAEWLVGDTPEADREFHAGELTVPRMMALIQHASVVVGGVGFIVPAALAMGVPSVVIGGGLGGHNAPEVLTDRRIDSSRMRFILPDKYCRCRQRLHKCPKHISDFGPTFSRALTAVTADAEAAA